MQTITQVNPIRLPSRSSLLSYERRQVGHESERMRRPSHGNALSWLTGVVGNCMHGKACTTEDGRADGKGHTVSDVTRKGRDRVTNAQPNRTSLCPSAVRVLIRAKSPGNAGGAKEGRKRNT